MAENLADEDDDEGFGDFKFAPNPNPNPNSFPINFSSAGADDDDWGDFMVVPNIQSQTLNPLQFGLSNGSSHYEASKPLDPFTFFSDQSVPNRVDSVAESARFQKPVGALPLSLFGDVEDEEEEVVVEGLGVVNASASGTTGLSLGSSVVRSDSIMDLYKRSGLDSNSNLNENGFGLEGDEDGWEFKDAYSGVSKEPRDFEFAGLEVKATAVDREIQVDNGAHGLTDLFAMSDGFSNKSGDLKPSRGRENGFISDSYSQDKQNGTENGWYLNQVTGNGDHDETLWDFKNASSVTGSKQKEPNTADTISSTQVELLSFDDEAHDSRINMENHEDILPPSIFSDGLGYDPSLNLQDAFISTPTSHSVIDIKSQPSNVSFSDLIFDLYSQVEPTVTVNSLPKSSEFVLNSEPTDLDSNLVDNDDFDDDSWEFKVAVSETTAKDQTVSDLNHGNENFCTDKKAIDYVDFYCKLKEELNYIALYHLESKKKAQNMAALSREDTRAEILNEEIQEAYKELEKGNMVPEEVTLDGLSTRTVGLREILAILREPEFQELESEYHMSRRLVSAEKDFKSMIELLKHVTNTFNILRLRSKEEQSNYVSTWSKMISVCAQELKYGAWIWKQSSEKNLQSQLLSQPQGKRFIHALGEIYRVVEILGASAKTFKPWVLSNSGDSMSIYALLEECFALWSSTGLEEVLSSISDPVASEYDAAIEALIKSIKYVHDLDELSLQDSVISQLELVCQLSLLSPGIVPGMKMVVWKGEQYFLALANLWANLVSHDPPKVSDTQMVG